LGLYSEGMQEITDAQLEDLSVSVLEARKVPSLLVLFLDTRRWLYHDFAGEEGA